MTTVPAGAKMPQDRKKPAVKAEGQGTPPSPIVFTYHDTEYTLDPAALDDLDVMEALEDQRMVTFLRLVLGDQYDRMKDQLRAEHGTRVTGESVGAFVEAMFGAVDPTGKR